MFFLNPYDMLNRESVEFERREQRRQQDAMDKLMYEFNLEMSITAMQQELQRHPGRRYLTIRIINARKELKALKDA
jgi:hypothetical protein